MDDEVLNSASPMWVRLVRMCACLILASAIGWRGLVFEDARTLSVAPFVMCELTACVLGLLGLFSLDGSREVGPS